jgi:hypothetical protein
LLWEILPFSFGFKETLGKLCKGNFVFWNDTQKVIPTLVKNHAGGRVIWLALKIRDWRCLAARIMLPDLGMPLKYIYQPADPAIRR